MLIWLMPVLCIAAGLFLAARETYRHLTFIRTEGEIVRVYEWKGDSLLDSGTTTYGPVFRYTWQDGMETEASTGMAYRKPRFAIGDKVEIRYDPTARADVLLPGLVNFAPGLIVAAIGLILTLAAGHMSGRLRRWQGGVM